MPVTVGVFVNPGVVPAASEAALPRFNRSFEYDSVDDRYVRFLLEELLPEVGEVLEPGAGRQRPGHRRGKLGGDLRLQRGVAPAGRLQSRVQHDRDVRRSARRPRLPDARAQDRAEADPGVPAGRLERPQHLRRRLVAREPGDGLARSSSRATTWRTCGATAPTTASTAGRSSPTRCAGSGATTRLPIGSAGPSKQPLLSRASCCRARPWQEVARGEGPLAANGRRRRGLRRRRAAHEARGRRDACRLPGAPGRRAGSRVRTGRAALRRTAGCTAHRGVGRERARDPRRGPRVRSRPRGGPRRRACTRPNRGRRASSWRIPRTAALSAVQSAIAAPSGLTLSARPEPAARGGCHEPVRLVVPGPLRGGSRSSSPSSTCTRPRAPPRAGRRASRWTRTATCT